MHLSSDLRDFIAALNAAEVRYMIVGGYATIFHGYSRSTQDIDTSGLNASKTIMRVW